MAKKTLLLDLYLAAGLYDDTPRLSREETRKMAKWLAYELTTDILEWWDVMKNYEGQKPRKRSITGLSFVELREREREKLWEYRRQIAIAFRTDVAAGKRAPTDYLDQKDRYPDTPIT